MHGTEQLILDYQQVCCDRDVLKAECQRLWEYVSACEHLLINVVADDKLNDARMKLGLDPTDAPDTWHEDYHKRHPEFTECRFCTTGAEKA